MELSIVIVTYNTCDLLRNCLKSIYNYEQNISYEVIVVDNNSKDNTVHMLNEEYPQVILIKNAFNEGFAKGNNIAINKSKGRYLLLLNSDTIVTEKCIEKMVDYLNSHNRVGILGCKLKTIENKIQLSASWFPDIFTAIWGGEIIPKTMGRIFNIKKYPGQIYLTEKEHCYIQEVDWVVGACMLVKRDVTKKVGLMDEKIFMYGEEVEWCYRIKKWGWKIVYYPFSEIYHFGSYKSIKRSSEAIKRSIKGERYFYYKYHNKLKGFIRDIIISINAINKIIIWIILFIFINRKGICWHHIKYNYVIVKEIFTSQYLS